MPIAVLALPTHYFHSFIAFKMEILET